MDFLPTSKKEMDELGWDAPDVILFTGDAYIDHPAFGAAVVGRVLEAVGLHVAVVPQPNWQDDLRDFRKFGRPRLFFAVTSGNMDSMVNHYTANKRRRSDDAYTPGGQCGKRPDRALTVYGRILKELYPDVPLVVGGIEASMRRLTHYDYWNDMLMPSVLADCGADLLFYGMAEKSLAMFAQLAMQGVAPQSLRNIPQTAFLIPAGIPYATDRSWTDAELHPHEACLRDKRKFAENFVRIETESNRMAAAKLIQRIGGQMVVVNPPWPPLTESEMDRFHAYPFTRLPHPRYRTKGAIPAYGMIRHSVTAHRGCFGGCAFCAISAHQGKFIASRSPESVMQEVDAVTRMPDFRGTLTDIGGPSANMYRMQGRRPEQCRKCGRPSCIFPAVCANMNTDHALLSELYRRARQHPAVKNVFIGSGIRYDLPMHPSGNADIDRHNADYLRELITRHTSGRLKVAPEHTSARVLSLMRKPAFALFQKFRQIFMKIAADAGLNLQIIPYFISSHPGCTNEDMAELAAETKAMNFHLEQVQDFTPTPMTLSAVMFYTGLDPYTMTKIHVARTAAEKLGQRKYFFWYKKEEQPQIRAELARLKRPDLLQKLFGKH
ncbi:MAG: YgiQ family radical SAM protein [Bacteroidales bacterium]|jgi:uncharacterized radical SAM protein YgiQ|nr:YgiQ family radical SAM protein [Bacteroidales bacterium]